MRSTVAVSCDGVAHSITTRLVLVESKKTIMDNLLNSATQIISLATVLATAWYAYTRALKPFQQKTREIRDNSERIGQFQETLELYESRVSILEKTLSETRTTLSDTVRRCQDCEGERDKLRAELLEMFQQQKDKRGAK